jgi:hypothetical protein
MFLSLFLAVNPFVRPEFPARLREGQGTGYGFEMAGKRPEAYIL